MTLNITVPKISPKGSSTKDLIISVLSKKWPLTSKEIYNTLKRECALTISYQAVHKTLNELIEEGVLEKENKEYSINKKWVQNIKKFGEELQENIIKEKRDPSSLTDSLFYKFNSLMEFAHFLINDYFGKFPNPERKIAVCFWHHNYPIVGLSEEEHIKVKEIFSYAEHYGIARCDTPADRLFAGYLTKFGKKCVTGVDFSSRNDIYIQGDFILEVYFTKEFNDVIDKHYNNFDLGKNPDLSSFFELASKRTMVHASITKNPKLADMFREEAKRLYGLSNPTKSKN